MQEKLDQLKKSQRPEPIRSDGAGALDLGPRDLKRDEENPDMIVPPATDHGLLPNLRFPVKLQKESCLFQTHSPL